MSIRTFIKDKLLPNVSDSDAFSTNKKEKEVVKVKHVAPIVYNVTSYYEIEGIAKNLFSKQSIIVNLSNLDVKDKYRVIDFLSGVVYSLKGKREKLEENIYIFSVSDN